MRLRPRVDRNQREIVAALRQAGCSVVSLAAMGQGCPDLLVGRHGRTYLLEIKAEKGRPNELQVEWSDIWRGHLAVVWSVEDALKAVSHERT